MAAVSKLQERTEEKLAEIEAACPNCTGEPLPKAISLRELSAKEIAPNDPIITGVLDLGTKMMIVGKAKSGKTFVALTLAIHIAAGKAFSTLEVPSPRPVLYVNYELRELKLFERCHNIIYTPGVGLQCDVWEIVTENLHLINLRGVNHSCDQLKEHIIQQAELIKPAVIILDPLYLLLNGNENDSQVARTAAFIIDEIVKKTGAAFIYIHHDVKGKHPGDRLNVDRGSGSGLLGRHWDSQITITPQADSGLAIVLDFESRDCEPHPAVVLERVSGGCFAPSELPPVKQDRTSERAGRLKEEDMIRYVKEALDYIAEKLNSNDRVQTSEVRRMLRGQCRLSDRKVDDVIARIPGDLSIAELPVRFIRTANNHNYFEKTAVADNRQLGLNFG